MKFRKHIDPRCAYCVHGSTISDTQVACVKRGIVAMEYRCGSFRYDPLRRIPQRPVDLPTEKLRAEDFEV